MRIFNLFAEQEWDNEHDREGYRHRVAAIAPRLGGKLLGGSLYELRPGERTWPDPAGAGGRARARGRRRGRVSGRSEGAHQLSNRTREPCRVLLLSSKAPVALAHFPDSGKVGLWSGAGGYDTMLRNEPRLDYWEGE
jgi:hypothetical protein